MKQIVITGENLNIVTSNVEATAATKKTKAQMRLYFFFTKFRTFQK